MTTKTTAQELPQSAVDQLWLDNPMVRTAIGRADRDGTLSPLDVLTELHDMMTDLEARCPNIDYRVLFDAAASSPNEEGERAVVLSDEDKLTLARMSIDFGADVETISSVVGQDTMTTLAAELLGQGWSKVDVHLATGVDADTNKQAAKVAALEGDKANIERVQAWFQEGKSKNWIRTQTGFAYNQIERLLSGRQSAGRGRVGTKMLQIGKFSDENGFRAAMAEFECSKGHALNCQRQYRNDGLAFESTPWAEKLSAS